MPVGTYRESRYIRNLLQNLSSYLRMLLNLLIFFFRQTASFIDNCIRNTDLPNIMELSHIFNIFLLIGGLPHASCDLFRIPCNSSRVTIRVLVLGIDCFCKCINNLIRKMLHLLPTKFCHHRLTGDLCLEVLPQVLVFQNMSNSLEEYLGLIWLTDKIGRSLFDSTDFKFPIVIICNHDNGCVCIRRIIHDTMHQIKAIDFRKGNIDHDEIPVSMKCFIQTFFSSACTIYFEAVIEDICCKQAILRVIIYHENSV